MADADCRFRFISAINVASSHDSSSFYQSALYTDVLAVNLLVAIFNLVLDEAYPNTDQTITPWKGTGLSLDRDAFNYWLSRQRQVIERAFGILIQRWGIFWRPLRCSMENIVLIITVAIKLHNLCIDHYTKYSKLSSSQ
jgi:hypothetical protein